MTTWANATAAETKHLKRLLITAREWASLTDDEREQIKRLLAPARTA